MSVEDACSWDFKTASEMVLQMSEMFSPLMLPTDILNQPLFLEDPKYSKGTIPRPHLLIKKEI
jgi:hypothetical protein